MTKRWIPLVAVCFGLAAAAGAQEKAEAARPRKPGTPLKVDFVFSRFAGERKVGSVPYMMWVNADDDRTRVRMGIDIPILPPKEVAATSPIVYKSVGTNIDCGVETLDDGRFKLNLIVEDSSLYAAETGGGRARDAGSAANPPVLRTFRSNFVLLLRDGQSGQFVAATDPVSGEVLKVDVTLSRLK